MRAGVDPWFTSSSKEVGAIAPEASMQGQRENPEVATLSHWLWRNGNSHHKA
jgi:hypothetical protein